MGVGPAGSNRTSVASYTRFDQPWRSPHPPRRRLERLKGGRVLMPMGSNPEPILQQPKKSPAKGRAGGGSRKGVCPRFDSSGAIHLLLTDQVKHLRQAR